MCYLHQTKPYKPMTKEELLHPLGRFMFPLSEVQPNESILTLSVGEIVDF